MEQPWLEAPTLAEFEDLEEEEEWTEESEDEEAGTDTELEDEDLLAEEEADLFEEEMDLEEEAEESWPNPFAAATGEGWVETEELEDWSSPFATEEEWEGTAAPMTSTAGASCLVDKQAPGPRWQHRPKTPITLGQTKLDRFPRNEILELLLTDFRVDDFRLMQQHQAALQNLAKEVVGKVGDGTYVGDVRVRAVGMTSSTASIPHNVKLSEHRAWNVIQTLRCLIGDKLRQKVDFGWNAVGEQISARRTGQSFETPVWRGVMVRVMAPIACPKHEPPGRPVPTPPPTSRTTTLCISVPRIDPRRSGGIPPDVIPLGSVVSGLPLPVSIVTKARAEVKVDNQSRGGSQTYELRGWGLEISMPSSGRVSVDLRARLQTTLDLIVRASASLAGKLQLGPLGLVLRIDASVFARLVMRLATELRGQLSVAFAPRPLPERSGCTRVVATPTSGVYSSGLLTGPATLLVPGRGLGPAQLRLGSTSVRLNPNPMALAADKSTVRTVLLIGGDLRLVGGSSSRAYEADWLEAESFDAWETEELPELESVLVRGV